jgi:hypothetical protein
MYWVVWLFPDAISLHVLFPHGSIFDKTCPVSSKLYVVVGDVPLLDHLTIVVALPRGIVEDEPKLVSSCVLAGNDETGCTDGVPGLPHTLVPPSNSVSVSEIRVPVLVPELTTILHGLSTRAVGKVYKDDLPGKD